MGRTARAGGRRRVVTHKVDKKYNKVTGCCYKMKCKKIKVLLDLLEGNRGRG
jgi:hypothetical protein